MEGVLRGEGSGDGLSCSLFTRLAGGTASRGCCSGESGFELERCGLELGSCTPREGSDSDFLLVLYGILATQMSESCDVDGLWVVYAGVLSWEMLCMRSERMAQAAL